MRVYVRARARIFAISLPSPGDLSCLHTNEHYVIQLLRYELSNLPNAVYLHVNEHPVTKLLHEKSTPCLKKRPTFDLL